MLQTSLAAPPSYDDILHTDLADLGIELQHDEPPPYSPPPAVAIQIEPGEQSASVVTAHPAARGCGVPHVPSPRAMLRATAAVAAVTGLWLGFYAQRLASAHPALNGQYKPMLYAGYGIGSLGTLMLIGAGVRTYTHDRSTYIPGE